MFWRSSDSWNESRLHSHLGKGFSGDYGINKCRQYIWAQRFVWVTDCYAVKFILSYEGTNLAVLRLQMRLMCWDVDIIHRPDVELVDADYWSRLGVEAIKSVASRGQVAKLQFAYTGPWKVTKVLGASYEIQHLSNHLTVRITDMDNCSSQYLPNDLMTLVSMDLFPQILSNIRIWIFPLIILCHLNALNGQRCQISMMD